MPTVNLNRRVVEELIGKKVETDVLKERISMIGTDLKSIDENKIVVEIFPNRTDMLGEQGFARAISSFMGINTGLRKYNVIKSDYRVNVDKSVSGVRPFTACAVVRGLELDNERIDEIIKLQEKLHITFCRNRKRGAIGIYPMEKITWPINYTAKQPSGISFIPLDFKQEMLADEILEKHPAGKEYGSLLEGMELYPIFIDSEGKILSMPPIINSELTGKVTEETTDVFIECSGFDINVMKQMINIITSAFADMDAEVYVVEVIYPEKGITTPDLEPRRMNLSIDYVNSLLGLKLSKKEVRKYVRMMGMDFVNKHVLFPAYRTDVLHPIDIVEDIAIAYGYNKFEPEIPNISTVGQEDAYALFQSKIAASLVGLGFLELNTRHISSRQLQEEKMLIENKLIELESPKAADIDVLRAQMLPGILDVLMHNKRHEYPQKVFEIGTVFHFDESTETNVGESVHLCAASAHAKADFTEVKQVLDYIFNLLGIGYIIHPVSRPSFIKGRVGKIMIGREEIGIIGDIHPKVLDNFNLLMPVSALEINLDPIFEIVCKEVKK